MPYATLSPSRPPSSCPPLSGPSAVCIFLPFPSLRSPEISIGLPPPSHDDVISWLADRLLERTGTIRKGNGLTQYLDNLQLRTVLESKILTMTSRTLRRRLHHDDDGRGNDQLTLARSDSLNEPLLGNYDYGDKNVEVYASSRENDLWDDEKKEKLHWTFLFSQLIAQWAQWIANIIVTSSSFLGKLMALPSNVHSGQDSRNSSFVLSPLQEERLGNLKHRLEVPYDGSRVDHQDALRELWRLAYPGRELPPLKSELWKEMGWQGTDPSTDFRGGGFISLENLIFFAKHFPEAFQRLLHKQEGRRSEWEYPFAVAGINVSFMLAQMLDLQSAKPSTLAGVRFLQLLALDEMAFDKLYCVAFRLMDAQWLAKHASYMEFNDVLKSTRTQLERELELEDVSSVQDLPAFNMLNQ